MVTSCATANIQDKKTDLDSFINGLDSSCVYEDGYTCAELPDPRFYSKKSQEAMLPAVYVQAWTSAYETFQNLAELTSQQKELKHYKIGFSEEKDQYIVLFSPLLLPYLENGEPKGISTGIYGMSVKVWVDKKTLSVTKQLFLK